MGIRDKVKDTIKEYNLIDKNDKIIVGVSGGPDSVTLLYLLNSLKKELKISLHVAHLDHMLRKDSCKDKRFVERLAGRLKLPVTCARINVREIARCGSPEEIARNARLGFLFRVAKDTKADKIALGHNLDDQAETVLMRTLRGAGLYGLSGIAPKRNISGYSIIRPLIKVRRKEIQMYLRRRKIRARLDTTNLEDLYLRNKIRNRLLPLLEEEYNQNIKEVLSNMAESVGCDYDYLAAIARRFVKKTKARVDLKKLLKLHPAIQRLSLRLMIAKIQGDTRRITFRHIREIEDMISKRPVNSVVDLPKGVSIVKKRRSIFFYRR
ncbi:MAG: tRNA lysidine(34) synthetase TilS [Candidatus Omnitrophica bacterium]|nr:tRNA lysidine(34) synthetase TilS [Candidatus Omnitrophota bacterium]MBU4472578.1 tRNA lysidine(34) synthetase TilS [Candidatus Omnitrophota bacterium]MCG2705954.1 tRNA lysidine(34) synthetase TilS [Candidatus Omnitrophota bacterium]